MPDADGQEQTPAQLRHDGEPLGTAYDVAEYFDVPHSRMIWTLYKAPDEHRYTHFEIPKRTGGMRPIHAPIGLLRELQDKLCADLKPLYRAHPNAHGFIGRRSVATNAADHTGKRWVLNVDLKDFFPSINFGRIRGLFKKPPFEMGSGAATVCAQIVTACRRVRRRLLRCPTSSRPVSTACCCGLRVITASSTRAMPMTLPFPPTLRSSLRPSLCASRSRAAGGVSKPAKRSGTPSKRPVSRSTTKRFACRGIASTRALSGCASTAASMLRANAFAKSGRCCMRGGSSDSNRPPKEHFHRYRRATQGAGEGNRSPGAFRNIVYGQLSFVKMVRGSDDPLFLKLCSQVLELDPNPSKFLRQMVFGADDYEVFISHASEDKAEIARPIFEACERAGLKAFLDEAHIGFGQSFTSKINIALGASRTVLAVISSHSTTKDWPLQEINSALALEVSGNKRVIPVMVGNPDLTNLPLIETKKWIVWDGDAGKVVRELQKHLRPPEPPPARSVPVASATQRGASSPDKGTAGPAPAKRSWFSRMFGSPSK